MTRSNWKHRRRRIYRWLPSWTPAWHDKRRKGLQAALGEAWDLECQLEQDRIFWNRLLHPEGGGRFWEIGAGDGSTGSHTLGLEQTHGWIGGLTEPRAIPRGRAERIRQCRVMAEFEPGGGGKESWDLVAIHRPLEFPGFWTEIKAGRLRPGWLVVENPRPDPRWCRLLEDRGYRLKFFFTTMSITNGKSALRFFHKRPKGSTCVREMKIAFHSSYLGYRGTEVALMDYAWGNQEILGHQSFFLLPHGTHAENHPVAERMRAIAPLRFYRSPGEREDILREESADFFYCIKNGWNDGVFSPRVPTAVHAIFRESEFHGDVYAYVSSWLSGVMSYGKTPWVPHMVRLAAATGCVRSEAGIPPEDFVFGRHGGDDSFDLPWVHRAVIQAARRRPDIWFLFLNTREFQGAAGLSNLRFLPPTADPARKAAFLGACDAMLHGRERGETFGLSCLEFAAMGKPVLTYAGSPERAHLENLGRVAVPYGNPEELAKLLRHPERFCPPPGKDGVRKAEHREPLPEFRDYQPEAVMKKFREVFLV